MQAHDVARLRDQRARAAERRGAGQRARVTQPPVEALEAQDLPALLARHASELAVGVDRDRVPDRAQHRQVGLGVRVRPRRRQVDALALRQLPHRLRLPFPVGERPARPPRVLAVDDLRPRADRAVERQHDREQLRHLLRRRRADHDRPPRVLVAVGELEHPRVQPREHAGQHVGREPLEVAHAHAGQQLPDPRSQRVGAGVGRAAQAEQDVLVRVAQQHAAVDEPGPVRRAPELERRRALHQRAIEIEERRSRFLGATHRAAPRWPWEELGLGHTLTITASPWPPPEQIAAQP